MLAVSYDHPDGNPCGAKEASTEQPAVFIPIERDVVENVISSTGSDQERPSIAGMLQGPDAGQKRVSNKPLDREASFTPASGMLGPLLLDLHPTDLALCSRTVFGLTDHVANCSSVA
jgi:hypothetical protein